MDYREFYKEQYTGTLTHKSEINNSLSTPIGILTALIAGFFYALTNFDFTDNKILTIVFILISSTSVFLLGKSVYFLIRAFSDFHNGFEYAFLNDADILKQYYDGLVTYYDAQPNSNPTNSIILADKDFNEHLLTEYIKTAGINQRNNDSKITYRFQCHRYMIFALISLTLLVIPFGIDFGINKVKDKVQKVQISSPVRIINKDTTSKEILTSIRIMAKQQIEKPKPPPTKMVREGVNPNINRPKLNEGGQTR